MKPLKFSILDTNNKDEVANFERTLFQVFRDDEFEFRKLVREYDFENKRMRFKIPYSSLEIYIAKIGNKITSGVAVNYNTDSQFEVEMLGFTIDKNEKGICEGLGLFNTQLFMGDMLTAAEFRKYVLKQMLKREVTKCYGTCSQDKLRAYKFLGWKDIDSRVINGIKKYLIVTDVPVVCEGLKN